MENPLMVEELVTRATHMVHDLISAIFLDGLSDPLRKVIQNLIPRDPLPLTFTSFSYPF